MRVGFLASGFVWTPGGSHRVVWEYATRLKARGHEVMVVHPIPLARLHEPRRWYRILRSFAAGSSGSWFGHGGAVQERRLLGTLRSPLGVLPEVDIWVGMLPTDLIRHWLMGTRRPWMVFVQHPKEVPMAKELPVTKISVGWELARMLEAAGVGDVRVVPNGVDRRLYRAHSSVEDRGEVVGMIWVPKEAKDPLTGLRALEFIGREAPGAEAILWGPRRFGPRVGFRHRYLGPLDAAKSVAAYNRCRVFILSSVAEGFGLPALEAMACGCAVVATDSGGVRDVVRDGETGFLVPPRDYRALGGRVLELLANPTLCAEIVRRGEAWAATFDWERSADLLEEVIVETAGQGGTGDGGGRPEGEGRGVAGRKL